MEEEELQRQIKIVCKEVYSIRTAETELVEIGKLIDVDAEFDEIRKLWDAIKESTPESHSTRDIISVMSRVMTINAYRGEKMAFFYEVPKWAREEVYSVLAAGGYIFSGDDLCLQVSWQNPQK